MQAVLVARKLTVGHAPDNPLFTPVDITLSACLLILSMVKRGLDELI